MRLFLLPLGLLGALSTQAQDLKPVYRGNPPYSAGDNMKQPAPQASAAPASNGALLRPNEYLFTTWSLGSLHPYTGPTRRAWLMYNAVSRQLVERVLQGKSNTIRAVNMDLLREFVVGDSSLNLSVTYRRYLNMRVAKPSLRTAFYEVHYDAGRTALLCQRTHNPALPTVNMRGFTGRSDVLRYFIKNTDNQIIPIELKSAEIFAALGPTHAAALTTFAQAQHLNFELEQDIVRLLAYHDSL